MQSTSSNRVRLLASTQNHFTQYINSPGYCIFGAEIAENVEGRRGDMEGSTSGVSTFNSQKDAPDVMSAHNAELYSRISSLESQNKM